MDNNFDFNTLNHDTDQGDAPHITADIAADGFTSKAKKAKDVVPEALDLAPLAPLAPTHDEKGFMRFMPALIKEMNRRGVPFTLNGGTGEIQLSGFYRAQGVTMEIGEGDAITITDRRGSTAVATYDDLVMLNFEWWTRSNGRGENVNPDRPWLDEFLSKSLVKRQTIYVAIEGAGE